MPRKRKFTPKDGSIGKSPETAIYRAAKGIITLSKDHQLHTVSQCETPELLQTIALTTTYPEVKVAAEANASYPHPPPQKRSRNPLVSTR